MFRTRELQHSIENAGPPGTFRAAHGNGAENSAHSRCLAVVNKLASSRQRHPNARLSGYVAVARSTYESAPRCKEPQAARCAPDGGARILQTLAAFTIATTSARMASGSSGQADKTTAKSGYSVRTVVANLVARGGRGMTLVAACSCSFLKQLRLWQSLRFGRLREPAPAWLVTEAGWLQKNW